jgi:hypothetical protein
METQPALRPDAPPAEVRAAAAALFAEVPSIQVATLGGPYTPWILGAYFTTAPDEPLELLLMVEKHGKSMKNLRADPRVAFTVNTGDAMHDFAQGAGRAEVLDDDAAPLFLERLVAKMPWFKLYTPCAPVRIRVEELFVTSFSRGWMPAQRLVAR